MDEQRESRPEPLVDSIDRCLARAFRVEPLLYADLLMRREQLAADARASARAQPARRGPPGRATQAATRDRRQRIR